MKREDFDKFLFENPDAKSCPPQFIEHLKECAKCSSLWKIQESLTNISEDKISFSFSPAKRANLIISSKKELFNKSASSLIEDSLVISILCSLFIVGIVSAAPNLNKFQFFERFTPYIKFLSSLLAPFLKEVHTIFTSQGGGFLGVIALFFIVFALTLFVKTINVPKIVKI
jgi:hypothetical protein